MTTKQFRKQRYISPRIEVVPLKEETPLMNTSFKDGNGHKKADDDTPMHAKQGWFDEEDEEFDTEETQLESNW